MLINCRNGGSIRDRCDIGPKRCDRHICPKQAGKLSNRRKRACRLPPLREKLRKEKCNMWNAHNVAQFRWRQKGMPSFSASLATRCFPCDFPTIEQWPSLIRASSEGPDHWPLRPVQPTFALSRPLTLRATVLTCHVRTPSPRKTHRFHWMIPLLLPIEMPSESCRPIDQNLPCPRHRLNQVPTNHPP